METAHWTQRILQIWIHLHLLCEFGRFDFDKGRCDRFHVRPITIERHSTRSNRILVLIRVNAYHANQIGKFLANVSIAKRITWTNRKSISYPHKQRHRKGHSWFSLGHRQSICRVERQQTPSYSDPISETLELRSSNRQLSMESPPPKNIR